MSTGEGEQRHESGSMSGSLKGQRLENNYLKEKIQLWLSATTMQEDSEIQGHTRAHGKSKKNATIKRQIKAREVQNKPGVDREDDLGGRLQ